MKKYIFYLGSKIYAIAGNNQTEANIKFRDSVKKNSPKKGGIHI